MDNSEQRFNRAVRARKLGRLATFSTAHPGADGYNYIRKFSEELVESARDFIRTLPPIHVDFIANGAVNAVAFKDEGSYFVGINTGTVFMLELLFMRMLSDTRLFRKIGDPNHETVQPDLTKCIPKAEEMAKAGFRSKRPKNNARHQYATLLLEQALLFLIGHEIAHVVLGHVDYLECQFGATLISERGWGVNSSESRIERQCIEVQADGRSAHSRIESLRMTYEANVDRKPPWLDAPLKPSEWIFFWAFAMNTLFRLFGDLRFDPLTVDQSLYPPLAIRRIMSTSSALGSVTQLWDGELKEEAAKGLWRGADYAEYAFAVMLGEKPDVKGFRSALSPDTERIYNRLLNYMPILHQKLAPFAFNEKQSCLIGGLLIRQCLDADLGPTPWGV